MDRKHIIIAATISGVLVLLAVTLVTATPFTSTPLYTLRMEKASNKMHFLPTEMNTFAYAAEQGYTLHYGVTGCSDDLLGKCTDYDTTCGVTCPVSCSGTCDTCSGVTCDATSCQPTCYTCEGPTCSNTCPGSQWTCLLSSCKGTC